MPLDLPFPFTLPRLFRSPAISNFFSFPLGLRNSGVRLYLLNYDDDGGSESSRPLFLPFFSTSYWPFRNGADTGQVLLVGVMVGGGRRVATVILNCTMRLFWRTRLLFSLVIGSKIVSPNSPIVQFDTTGPRPLIQVDTTTSLARPKNVRLRLQS